MIRVDHPGSGSRSEFFKLPGSRILTTDLYREQNITVSCVADPGCLLLIQDPGSRFLYLEQKSGSSCSNCA
jgi:hypothetical protein